MDLVNFSNALEIDQELWTKMAETYKKILIENVKSWRSSTA